MRLGLAETLLRNFITITNIIILLVVLAVGARLEILQLLPAKR
jgi:hypothetical protein